MKRFYSLFLSMICLAVPLWAQGSDKPREFGFNFNYFYTSKTRVTSFEIGYQRELPDAKPVVFEQTLMGKKGLLEKETLSFLGKGGDILGTLSTQFDAQGKLKSQTLNEKGRPARPLSWFKTKTQSPPLSATGSILKVSYTLKSGKLFDRLLNIQLPAGSREFRSHYDSLGRRETDISVSADAPLSLHFFYNEQGLSRFTSAATKKDAPKEVTLERAANGSISQIQVKEGGVLISRVLPSFNDNGVSTQMRMENFQNGILANAMILDDENKNIQQEAYDNGVLVARKTLVSGANNEQKLRSLEEFEAGKLQKRTQYDDNGAVTSITTFNQDGTVKDTQTFQTAPTNTP